MINSIRRIALSLFIISGLVLGAGVFTTKSVPCAICNASVLYSDLTFDANAAQSSPRSLPAKNINFRLISEALQIASLYIAIPALLLLIVLEIKNPYFRRTRVRRALAHK